MGKNWKWIGLAGCLAGVMWWMGARNSYQEVTVIVTTFGEQDDQGRWGGEAAPFMDILQNRKDMSGRFIPCRHAFSGTLFEQRVLVAVSGVGKVQAAACTDVIMRVTKGKIKELILAGIGGITPAKGGKGEPAVIGDVCINSAAVDFGRQHYSADSANSQWANPQWWEVKSDGFVSKVRGSGELADELIRAAGRVTWPELTPEVKEIIAKYHGYLRKPKAWGVSECVEVSDDLWWHDMRTDQQARILGSGWLKTVLGGEINEGNILALTSMEATAVGSTVARWNEAWGADVAFAYVRAASNYDRPWWNNRGEPAVDGKISLQTGTATGGMEMAYKTLALPVLKMLELRSE